MSNDVYLEMTYKHGKPVVGYLYLPRQAGDKSVRCRKAGPGLVVDYAADGRPIGIEITAPSVVSPAAVNALMAELDQEALEKEDLAPLLTV